MKDFLGQTLEEGNLILHADVEVTRYTRTIKLKISMVTKIRPNTLVASVINSGDSKTIYPKHCLRLNDGFTTSSSTSVSKAHDLAGNKVRRNDWVIFNEPIYYEPRNLEVGKVVNTVNAPIKMVTIDTGRDVIIHGKVHLNKTLREVLVLNDYPALTAYLIKR